METIYCAISFTGFSSIFDHGIVQAFMQVFSFVFILFIGFKFLLAKTVHVPTKLDAARKRSRRASSRNSIRTRPS